MVNKVYDFIRGIVGMLTHAVVTGLIGAMVLWVRDAIAYGYFGFEVASLRHTQRWYTYWNRPFDLMPGGKDPDRLFQVIALFWMVWVAAVVFSHVRRMLVRFQDKDKYHGRF